MPTCSTCIAIRNPSSRHAAVHAIMLLSFFWNANFRLISCKQHIAGLENRFDTLVVIFHTTVVGGSCTMTTIGYNGHTRGLLNTLAGYQRMLMMLVDNVCSEYFYFQKII